jgi:hypothetical protein
MPTSLSIYKNTRNQKNKKNSNQVNLINKKLEKREENEKKEEPTNNEEKKKEETLCFICLELAQPTNKIIKMKELILFTSDCACNSEGHIKCLFDWVNVSKSCPICREEIIINIPIYNEINYYYSHTIMMKIKHNLSIFFNMCYAVTMMIAKYITLLFVLNAILIITKEVYTSIIDKR